MIDTPDAHGDLALERKLQEARALMDDPVRARLGPVGRMLPATHQGIKVKALLQVARRMSVTKTLYWSFRLKGRCVVGRRTKVVKQPTARAEFAPGSWLLLGLHHNGPNRTLLDLGRNARLTVRGTVQAWRGAQIKVLAGGRLDIGDRCIFNEDSRVYCFKSITFADGSGLSWNSTALDSDLHTFKVGGRLLQKEAPIVFEERAFLGMGSTVLKGVRIGAGTVVGAGSLVTSDQPPNCLVAGNPARVIHRDFEWII